MTQLELQSILYNLKKDLDALVSTIDIDKHIQLAKTLEEKTILPDFWNDSDAAQKIISKMNEEKSIIEDYENIINIYETLELTNELAKEEETYDFSEAETLIDSFSDFVDKFMIKILLNEPYDRSNAYIEFHPGAGGTESQDWAQMLYRMYLRFADRKNYKTKIIDYQDGDEAGLKSATILIEGVNAYGYLKAESGVHRLVRISPFDSSSRRHTSFASVKVYPETDDSINI